MKTLAEVIFISVSDVSIVLLSLWLFVRRIVKKEDLPRRIETGLQQALFPILYPHFFSPDHASKRKLEQDSTDDKDQPFVSRAFISPKLIKAGNQVDIMLKIVDLGLNLDNPGGVCVSNSDGRRLAVVNVGLGYCRCSLLVKPDMTAGNSYFKVELTDRRNNKSERTISFKIEGD